MKSLLKRIVCVLVLLMTLSRDMGYNVYANEMENARIVSRGDVKRDKSKKNIARIVKKEKFKEAMRKIECNEELSQEDIDVVDQIYAELEIVLPEDEVTWEVDHEQNVGVSTYGLARTSSAVSQSLCYNYKTTTRTAGLTSAFIAEYYSNGEGGTYNFLKTSTKNFIMPGMNQTTVGNGICTEMAPQGICYYDGFFFITAYCTEHTHKSVIYVVNAISEEYITTLVLADSIHAGGIVYANGYLWIGDSYEVYGATDLKGCLHRYNYSQIKEAINCALNDKTVTAINMSYFESGKTDLGIGNKASFLTVYNGYICVGEYYTEDYEGKLNLYDPVKLLSSGAGKKVLTTIPKNANGVAFYTSYNQTYFIINANYGTKVNSKIHVYKINGSTTTRTKIIEMPKMVEEAVVYGSNTYFVFESCAKKYRDSKYLTPLGDVCAFSNNFIFK